MANIIESKKIKRVLHRFDTAENWKKSTVKLLPGELAFDERGNFKVGLSERPNGTLWKDLPFAGKGKVSTGTLEDRPTVATDDSYSLGDFYKDVTSNTWYVLSGFDAYGEYVWDEITSDTQALEDAIANLETQLLQKVDATLFEEALSSKADVEQLTQSVSKLATKNELLSIAELTQSNAEKLECVEESLLNALLQLEDKVEGEDLESLTTTLMSYTNEEVASLASRLEQRATKEDLQQAVDALEFNHATDIQEHEASVAERLSTKLDKVDATALEERLRASLSQKVDASTIFDESGNIKASLLPGSVDDIVEGVLVEGNVFMPLDGMAQVGVGGKLYLDVNTKTLYRWSGTQYVSISSGSSDDGASSSVVIGTVDGTAYEGSAGKRLEERVTAVEGNVASVSSSLSKTVEDVEKLRGSTEGLTNVTNAHATSILTLEVKAEGYDERIAEVTNSVREQSSLLGSFEKNILTMDNKVKNVEEDIVELKATVSKVTSIDNEVRTLKEKISSQGNSIATLNVTVNALSEQVSNLADVSDDVSALSESVVALRDAVDLQATTVTAQGSELSSLTATVDSQATSIAEALTSLEGQGTEIESLKRKTEEIDVLKGKLDEQSSQLAEQSETLNSHNVRLNSLEASDASQRNRLEAIESTVVQQVADVAEVKTALTYQNDKLTVIESKVDTILSIETPDGTLSLGDLAFKDTITMENISGSLSVSLLTQGDDEELELVGGDSSN